MCNDELPFKEGTFIDFNCNLTKGFKIGHLNIQSLRFKVDHVRILLNDNFDLLCLTETWLNGNINDSEIKIDGYNVSRLDRTHMGHGGILCYVKDGIIFKENSNVLYNLNNVEALWIEVNLPHTKPILIGTVYRQPDSKADYLENLDVIFQNCTTNYDDVVIVGDFNLDINKKCNLSKIKTLSSHSNMQQLIKDFTRITEKSKSKLDLIFVSKPDKVYSSGVHSLGLSDHSLVFLIRKNKKVQVPPKIIKSRCLKNLNEHDFIKTIKKTSWDKVLMYNNVDNPWFQIFLILVGVINLIKEKNHFSFNS
jgi:exonuclease III